MGSILDFNNLLLKTCIKINTYYRFYYHILLCSMKLISQKSKTEVSINIPLSRNKYIKYLPQTIKKIVYKKKNDMDV